MTKDKIKNLSDAELGKKYQKMNNISKASAVFFIICLLISIGYAGYA